MVAQITELERLPIEALRQKWGALFNTDPPGSSNRKQLVARLAYRIQELVYGGLSQEARDKLDQLAGMQAPAATSTVRDPDQPIPGTKLRREWKGVPQEVTVLDSGFEYAGKRYRSLSAIATAITGTKWNGPEFFGLRQRVDTDNSSSTRRTTAGGRTK
jgi:hypothetical protein